MSSNFIKTTPKAYQIEPTENKTNNLAHTTNEEVNKDLYYFSNKEKCARCKQQGVFICEHKTEVRDDLKHIYAEEGRYYLPRKSLRSENGSLAQSHPNSAQKSVATDHKVSSNVKMSNGKTSNNNNYKNVNGHGEKSENLASKKKYEKETDLNEKHNQSNKIPESKKKDDGCCLIS